MIRDKRRSKIVRKVNRPCFFCQAGKEPDYKDTPSLQKFLSPRARIMSRTKTGICAKHQRRLTESVKRARHLSLLPFVVSNQ